MFFAIKSVSVKGVKKDGDNNNVKVVEVSPSWHSVHMIRSLFETRGIIQAERQFICISVRNMTYTCTQIEIDEELPPGRMEGLCFFLILHKDFLLTKKKMNFQSIDKDVSTNAKQLLVESSNVDDSAKLLI